MSQTRLADCDNKDQYTIEQILMNISYYDTEDLNDDGTPKIKIRVT